MSRTARLGIVAGALLIVLCTIWALWLVLSPRQEVLFGNLAEADAAEIAATLAEWKVPYTLSDDGGTLLVDSAQKLDTRMRLVSAGIPKGGHVGYELFDDNDFGVTEFAQRINYQRALQGELERTIGSIPGVRNVRVHLSIRRAGSFLGEDATSKASVALTLDSGTTLSRRQVAGIRNLVASAVEGLLPEAVVVVGPAGLQLAGSGQTGDSLAEGADTASDLSARIEARIAQLLAEALHGQRSSVSVDVQMNFDKVRRTSEKPVTLAGQDHGVVVRRTRSGGAPAEGTAGGLVNEQVEYAHGSEREEVTRAVGVIERITVAVVLPAGVEAAEQQRLTRLATAAAGLDVRRGDRIEVSAAAPAVRGDGRVPGSGSAASRPDATAAARWQPQLWQGAVLLAFVFGAVLGALAMARRRRRPWLLSREESERAAIQVRAWLTDEATR
ncbi:MAG TPA: flagellar M-ring protein FliF [Stenotrophomonas sp.]|nr:flagellar M-ring protein FliF [Stenotrophomonas sp.]